MAEREEIDIRLHSVIYNVTEEIKKSMAGLLEPTFKEVRIGSAERTRGFPRAEGGRDRAGCLVTDGRITARARPRPARCATTWSCSKARSRRSAVSRTM